MMTERITSRKNPLLQQVKKLLSSKKAREEAGLYAADGTRFENLHFGGSQEKGLRPGTENLPGITGFALAAEISSQNLEEKAENVSVETEYENLSVCPSNLDLSGAEIELISVMGRENRLKQSLASAKDIYDFILIDTPPSLGLITVNTLTAADSIIIPIQCEFYALEGVSQLVETVKRIKKALNPTLFIEGIVMTMYDARTNLAMQVVDEVKRFFPGKVYRTIIPRNVRVSEAPGFGKPVIYYDEASKGAEAYIELAAELVESIDAEPLEEN